MSKKKIQIIPTKKFWTFTLVNESDEVDKNFRYFEVLLHGLLPNQLSSLDTSRMMILYFCVNSIELLNKRSIYEERITNWIYSRQSINGGFDGGSLHPIAEQGHLAMTYSALACLTILNDDLKRFNIESFCSWLTTLQDDDGSFRSTFDGSESDTRFVYSAVASSFLIQNFSGINVEKATKFVLNCYNNFEGGFGLRPGLESHGGATYTSLASLALMGKLNLLTNEQKNSIIRFCINKQISGAGGFCGRCNKVCDTCYAFWIGASLQILGVSRFIQKRCLNHFLDTTFNPIIGGFSKTSDNVPDPLHSHFGVCGRILCEKNPSSILDVNLGISQRVYLCKFGNKAKTASGADYFHN